MKIAEFPIFFRSFSNFCQYLEFLTFSNFQYGLRTDALFCNLINNKRLNKVDKRNLTDKQCILVFFVAVATDLIHSVNIESHKSISLSFVCLCSLFVVFYTPIGTYVFWIFASNYIFYMNDICIVLLWHLIVMSWHFDKTYYYLDTFRIAINVHLK